MREEVRILTPNLSKAHRLFFLIAAICPLSPLQRATAQISPRPGVARLAGWEAHALSLLLFLLLAVPCWGAWGTSGGTQSCSTADETSSTNTLSCTINGQDLNSGNVIFLVCAGDNTATSDGESNTHSNATDSQGNTWTKAKEWTEGTGGAAGGATVSLHYSKLTTTLVAPTDTITCNFGSNITDRAMTIMNEFTVTAGNVVSVVGSTGENSNGGDAGSLTISGLTSGEYLFVRGIATESNAAISMTATTSYSLPANAPTDGCVNTTGGGEASDMGACAEYRIKSSATGDTSDPTLVDTTNDNASVYVAFMEAAAPSHPPVRRPMEIQ